MRPRTRHLRTTRLRKALIAIAAAAVAATALAAPAGAKVGLKKIGNFKAPVYVDQAPGTKGLLVVEQPGRIVAVVKGKKRRRPFLDIRGLVMGGGEEGLLSVAFPPDYAQSGLFYVYYTDKSGDNNVAEFRAASKFRADPASRRIVLNIPHPGASNHNGGQIEFGPDGFLYIAPGDGGGAGDTDNSAQTTENLLGKLLRIDPRRNGSAPYTTPMSNPFASGPGRDEIYSIGLRNPFRFSFNGDTILIGDVGQDRFEEIDHETVANTNGANFGWNDFEGFASFQGAIPPGPSRHDAPIHAYPTGGRCSVIGGYVVRNRKLRGLLGRYIYGDFCDGRIRSLVPDLGGAKKVRSERARVESLSSFGETLNGALYATSLEGPVFRLKRRR